VTHYTTPASGLGLQHLLIARRAPSTALSLSLFARSLPSAFLIILPGTFWAL